MFGRVTSLALNFPFRKYTIFVSLTLLHRHCNPSPSSDINVNPSGKRWGDHKFCKRIQSLPVELENAVGAENDIGEA